MKKTALTLLVAAGLAFAPACAMDEKPDADDTKTGPDGKAEHWGSGDNPGVFASDLVMTFDDLPQVGEANEIPWAGNYWAVYKDSINDKWAGASSKSPTEKYAEAFGHNAQTVLDAVSKYHGIDSQSHRKVCSTSAECTGADSGSCSKRPGKETGYCIPTWFGICHAWAPVSILKPEPLHAVTYNGVEFKVQDIKALLTLIYNKTTTRFVSLRCNTDAPSVAFDNYGRPTGVDAECRDTNPGTLHLLLTNYLGIRGDSFVEDRTWDDEVWNQPLRGYRITQQKVVTAREANVLIGVTSAGGTSHDASGTIAKNAWFHMDPIAVTSGQSITVNMTGSGDADLYVQLGAQPTTSSYTCRPYEGSTNETCQVTATSNTQLFVSVQGYADTSDYTIKAIIGGSVPDAYEFNSNATDFRHVKIEVDYISESSPSTDGNLAGSIDSYTHTDRYEYVLELKKNSEGKLVVDGGEYIGASKQLHPDFLWLPVSHSGTTVAGGTIKRTDVMAIYELSRQTDNPDPGPGTGDLTTVDESGTVAKNIIDRFGPYAVKAGETFKVVMTGTADADLYVRAGTAPTTTAYDCRPYKSGSAEECTLVSTGAPIHVGVMGYAASSNYELHIEYVEGGGSTPPVDPPPATVTHLNVQDALTQGEMKHYTIALPAGYATKIQTFSTKDVDLYIQLNQAPTTDAYLGRAWTSSGNETLSYTPQANATLHIMVHGYEAAPSFTLRTSAQ